MPPGAARRGLYRRFSLRSFVVPAAAVGVLLVTVGVPIASLLLRHQRPFDLWFVWRQSGNLVLGSLFMAALAALASGALAAGGLRRRPRWGVAVALAAFLVGGQLLAVALIRLYNRPLLAWVYNGPPIMVLAYVGRFGWLALLAAGSTWGRPWRLLRAQAAVDGASAGQAARHVVWPLAWPLVLGAGVLVLVLSLTEVPATVLAAPHRPPQIVPMLMTWVHTLESDPMIEASLLLAGVVAAGAVVAAALVVAARRAVAGGGGRVPLPLLLLALFPLLAAAAGCGDRGQPDAVWMSTGTAPGQVVYPRAICYDKADDSFFVIDRVAHVQHLDRKGNPLGGWRMPEWANGKPVGVSVGPDGNVYVPDTHYHRVMVYTPSGQVVRQWGELGKGPGQFIYPTDVAFDEAGRAFVSEYGEHDRVQVFDAAGKYLFEFGGFGNGDGQFSRPQSLVIDKGLVYVTDSCNHRLVVFRTDGTFVRNMGGVGSELGQFRFPYGMDLDADGRLVVCEFGNNRVQLVDKETGKGLKTWGAAGREPGQLAYPWGVAIDGKGRVVAVDSGNNRLQVFSF
ncbi:MAG: pknD 3 [Phycisphaerales bacterium]|nr:pknD 3 [Phycisphaerales bacterium]